MSTDYKARTYAFTAGWSLLLIGWIAVAVAAYREHLWMYSPSSTELAWWIYGGLLGTILTMLLLLFGRGWKRWTFEVAALVELYLWFSWLGVSIMVHQ